MAKVELASFLLEMPKAELHVHLEGTLDAAVLAEMDERVTAEEVARRYQRGSFDHFLEAFKWAVGHLRR
jgi:aminodeoxyfutalosine deaminase